MKQAAEYRQHATECRKLALGARTDQERQQLMEMAAAWERMAIERERQIASEPEGATIAIVLSAEKVIASGGTTANRTD